MGETVTRYHIASTSPTSRACSPRSPACSPARGVDPDRAAGGPRWRRRAGLRDARARATRALAATVEDAARARHRPRRRQRACGSRGRPSGGACSRTHQWRGVIEEYRDRLPVNDETPVVTLREGGTPLVQAPAPVRADRLRGLPQGRGREPDRLLQGPRDDDGDLARPVEDGAKAVICASTGNTSRVGGRLRRPRRHDLRRARPAGQDRARQARPGAHARRAAPPGRRQLRRLPAARARARRATTRWRWSTRVNPFRIEGQKTAAFEIVDALGDAPDVHCLPVGNAGNITAYWKGYARVRRRRPGHASDPAMWGFQAVGCGADRAR